MVRSFGVVGGVALVVLGLGLATSDLSARELPGLSGSAGVMATLTEPVALLVWGSALAGVAQLVGRKRQ